MKKKIIKSIPNAVTVSRIIALILGFVFFACDNFTTSLAFYIYGALSDAIDGYLARKLDAYSKLGQYLDAVSDKLFSISIMLLIIIYGNKLIIIIAISEMIIALLNLVIIIKKKKVFTERVAKFKMTFVFITLLIALLEIKYEVFNYFLVPFLIICVYFEIQSILAYINQLKGKSKEKIVNLNGKPIKEKIITLFKEFKYYLLNPVRIIR